MHIVKSPPPHKQLYLLVAIVLFLIISIALQSCSAAKKLEREEKKALAPYVAVNSDVGETFAEKKLELGARYCQTHFPNEEKTIVKDSVVIKYIRVTDNAYINRLKAQIAAIKATQPNVNLDSLYSNFYDSVLLEIPPCKEVTHLQSSDVKFKDTFALYRAGVIIEKLKTDTNNLSGRINYYNAQYQNAQEQIKLYQVSENSFVYLSSKLWAVIWNYIRWWLLAAIVLFAGYTFLKGKIPFLKWHKKTCSN
jgi:hypothetical protein